MKKVCTILFIATLALSGCKKNDSPKLFGTDTINNTLYGTGPYYALGFSFTSAKQLSTLHSPAPDITIEADIAVDGSIRKIFFSSGNFDNSFYLFGTYSNVTDATQAFKSLTSFMDPQWNAIGDAVAANQVWLFKTSGGRYVKIRVISTVEENRNSTPYAETSFEWVYQPDGSLTFPGK